LVGGPTRGWVAAKAASRWVRISGMTCSVLPIQDSQPHSQLARRWPLSARAAGLTVTLCPATCSLTEMVTAHLRSVGDGRTYPRGKPVTKLPAQVQACAPSRSPWSRQGTRGCRLQRSPVCAAGPWWFRRSMRDGRSALPGRVTMAGEGTRKGLAAVPPCVAARTGWHAAEGARTAGPLRPRPPRCINRAKRIHTARPLHSPEGGHVRSSSTLTTTARRKDLSGPILRGPCSAILPTVLLAL
jgi:hypothetical protein